MKSRKSARPVALAALLGALSLIALYLSAIFPVARTAMVALAGLFPAAAVVSAGWFTGALCYAGTGILAVLMVPDLGNVFLYLLCFGLYPIVKYWIEQLGNYPLEWVAKLAFFNVVLTVLWMFFKAVLFSTADLEGLPLWLIYVGGNGIFAIYDVGFSKLISFYRQRVDKFLRK